MIVVDVETTGLDPKKHALLSIGAIDFNNTKNTFYIECQAWGGCEVDMLTDKRTGNYTSTSVLSYNGFTEETMYDRSKPTLKEAIEQFISWVNNCDVHVLAGHNTWFDRDFLTVSAQIPLMLWRLSRPLGRREPTI